MNALAAAWADFHLLRPHWLWALALVPVAVLQYRLRMRRADAWRGTVDAHLLPSLLVAGGRARWLGLAGALLAYALGVLALAGPSWRQEEQPLFRTHAPLVVALDLSPRVLAADLPPSRLLQARAKLAVLLRERKAGEVALLAYAGDSFTVAPLTDDAANVALFLDALDPSVMPVDGQRGDRAIAAAVRLLQQAEFAHGDILLLTDGADADARSQAAQAHAAGYRVSVLGLGLPQGAPYRQADGGIAQARLDEGALEALAAAGGGRYARLAAGDADLRALGVLEPARGDGSGGGEGDGLQWRDDGYWLLPLVMLLVLPAFRRRGALAVLALCLLPPLVPRAEAAEGTLWRRADQVEQQQLQAGTEAYRRGDFAAAQQHFEGIDSDQGWYNLGNALARQGHYDEAIAAYDKALAKHPKMDDAVANRAAVDAARKRSARNDDGGQGQGQQGSPNQQNQGKGQNQNQNQNQADNGQQQAPSPSGSGQSGQPKPDPGQSARSAPQQQGKQGEDKPQPGADPRAQQQADAAQRERMRQAMAAQKDAQAQPPGQAAAQPQESAAQREQRQALEAWMRRVPDDPGSLLRAKFRLEQERRQREGNP